MISLYSTGYNKPYVAKTLMARKTKPENERVVSPEAAAAQPRRQTTASRARRASAPAATPVPPAVDVDAKGTLEKTSSAAAPKPRRKTPAPRTTRSQAKTEKSAAPAAHPKTEVRLAVAEPSRQAIAALAYLNWQARAGRDGSADEDWLRAERELRQQVLRSALPK